MSVCLIHRDVCVIYRDALDGIELPAGELSVPHDLQQASMMACPGRIHIAVDNKRTCARCPRLLLVMEQ